MPMPYWVMVIPSPKWTVGQVDEQLQAAFKMGYKTEVRLVTGKNKTVKLAALNKCREHFRDAYARRAQAERDVTDPPQAPIGVLGKMQGWASRPPESRAIPAGRSAAITAAECNAEMATWPKVPMAWEVD